MRSSIYGYMRLAVGSDNPDESEHIEEDLKEFAEREGFPLDEVLIGNLGAKDSAFDVLIERLKRTEIRNVLVPSLWPFARVSGLQEASGNTSSGRWARRSGSCRSNGGDPVNTLKAKPSLRVDDVRAGVTHA